MHRLKFLFSNISSMPYARLNKSRPNIVLIVINVAQHFVLPILHVSKMVDRDDDYRQSIQNASHTFAANWLGHVRVNAPTTPSRVRSIKLSTSKRRRSHQNEPWPIFVMLPSYTQKACRLWSASHHLSGCCRMFLFVQPRTQRKYAQLDVAAGGIKY